MASIASGLVLLQQDFAKQKADEISRNWLEGIHYFWYVILVFLVLYLLYRWAMGNKKEKR